jgi:hypothetical protein
VSTKLKLTGMHDAIHFHFFACLDETHGRTQSDTVSLNAVTSLTFCKTSQYNAYKEFPVMNYGSFILNGRTGNKQLTCRKFVHSGLASTVVWG